VTGRSTAVPVLPVSDLVRALAWYERLGFTIVTSYPGYGILELDGAEVHLNECEDLPGPHETWSGGYLRVDDVDAVFFRWTAMGARAITHPVDQPWGQREFATEDLDGNLWRVGTPVAVEPEATSPDAPVMDQAAVAGDAPLVVLEAADAPDAPTDGSSGTGLDAWLPLVAGDQACAGCGMDPGELPARALGAEVRDAVHAFGELLADADDDQVRERGADGSWSALEYGVHVRDLLVVFAERIVRTLAEHEPELGWWDHEAAIADGMANESDVSAVVDDLGRNASKLSESLRLVDGEQWERAAIRRGSERFTIELMARFALHEVVHHRADAERALAAAAGRAS
jgi:catechol 2,3-dioxygenase-like lactoylglutathione lyase family enzyme